MQQAVGDQPGVLEEARLLDQVADPRLHQLGGELDVVRQQVVEEGRP